MSLGHHSLSKEAYAARVPSLTPASFIFAFFTALLFLFQSYQIQAQPSYEDCRGYRYREQAWKFCRELVKKELEDPESTSNCIECVMAVYDDPEEEKINYLDGVASILHAVAPPLASIGVNAMWSNQYGNVQQSWADAYTSGHAACNERFDNYLDYTERREMNTVLPNQASGWKCNNLPIGAYAGFGGMQGGGFGGFGGFGNPYINAGYTPGFMGAMMGPSFGMGMGGPGMGGLGLPGAGGYFPGGAIPGLGMGYGPGVGVGMGSPLGFGGMGFPGMGGGLGLGFPGAGGMGGMGGLGGMGGMGFPGAGLGAGMGGAPGMQLGLNGLGSGFGPNIGLGLGLPGLGGMGMGLGFGGGAGQFPGAGGLYGGGAFPGGGLGGGGLYGQGGYGHGLGGPFGSGQIYGGGAGVGMNGAFPWGGAGGAQGLYASNGLMGPNLGGGSYWNSTGGWGDAQSNWLSQYHGGQMGQMQQNQALHHRYNQTLQAGVLAQGQYQADLQTAGQNYNNHLNTMGQVSGGMGMGMGMGMGGAGLGAGGGMYTPYATPGSFAGGGRFNVGIGVGF